MRRGELSVALGYALASLVSSIALLWAGMAAIPHIK
jgi:hypothetical protein